MGPLLHLQDQNPLIVSIFNGDFPSVEKWLETHAHPAEEMDKLVDADKRHPIHAAAFIDQSDILEALIVATENSGHSKVNVKDAKWLTPLHRACRSSAEYSVEVLLTHNADVNARDRCWQTPAHVAAANNAVRCMELLVPRVSNINITDRTGRTCLHLAAYFGHYEMVETLLQLSGTVNHTDKRDRRPIHWAAFRGHEEVVRLLVQHNAGIEVPDKDKNTPLHAAAAAGFDLVVQILLDFKANPEAVNKDGNTPAHLASLNGHHQVLSLLIETAPKTLQERNAKGELPIHLCASSTHGEGCLLLILDHDSSQVREASNDGKTPLLNATLHGRLPRVLHLIRHGAELNVRDKKRQTALHLAAKFGHEAIIGRLLDMNANPLVKEENGRTPLHLSAQNGHLETCRQLSILPKVDLNTKDANGMTCLHLCAFKDPEHSSRRFRRCRSQSQETHLPMGDLDFSQRNADCLKCLIDAGADIHIKDKFGRTALHYASVKGWFQCVHHLVTAGCSVDCADHDQITPLMLATLSDSEAKCVEYLLVQKANGLLKDHQDLNVLHYAAAAGNSEALTQIFEYTQFGRGDFLSSKLGVTPIHLAAKSGHTDSVIVLLGSQAQGPNDRDSKGRTALHFAARHGHLKCLEFLLAKGALVGVQDDVQGRNPVHEAAENGEVDCLLKLLEHTEDFSVVEAKDKMGRTPLMLAAEKGHSDMVEKLLVNGSSVATMDLNLRTPMFYAVFQGMERTTELLLKREANILQVDRLKKSVFHIAAAAGQISVLGLLVESLDEPTAVNTMLDQEGFTPLHWAALKGHEICVEYLTQRMTDQDILPTQFSPVHCAVHNRSDTCLVVLLNKFDSQTIANLRDDHQRTPLHIAAFQKSASCAKLLLSHGADPNAKDASDLTPLSIAIRRKANDIVELLLKHEAKLDETDPKGNTALHHACKTSDPLALAILKACSSNQDIINMQNVEGQSALHLTGANGFVESTDFLVSHGASVTLVDNRGYTPVLACAPNDNVALCLATMFAEYLKCPLSDTRRSIASLESFRLSDGSAVNHIQMNHQHQNQRDSSDSTFLETPPSPHW
ncbi:serine/threonine-protein phosphatase 6 regulatory ankyrin repeat subunit A-like isoform X2 [Tigriopus californicus]|uniref:serine/threonine-protein phosphatase 6 regulatory ankyrin repeat subunit A-like isoform X2 n=1 Tax=Tigriopus californicus TaxID=6832 RepID=UPI0027DA0A9B|nr:serine/threonine-protein phosphatase 6 regulatory ankyrin repeat subunit A-like isoform X2 [Tigriopus californicus]